MANKLTQLFPTNRRAFLLFSLTHYCGMLSVLDLDCTQAAALQSFNFLLHFQGFYVEDCEILITGASLP